MIATIVLACILISVECRSSNEPSFVRRDANVTTDNGPFLTVPISSQNSTTTTATTTTATTTTASGTSSSSTITSSSIQSSSTVISTSTPAIFSTTSSTFTSTKSTTTSSSRITSTFFRSLSTSATPILPAPTSLTNSTESSSSSSSTSSTSPTFLVEPTPSVTLSLNGGVIYLTSTDPFISPTPSPVSAAASSRSSFWKNKAAKTAVIVIVVLIACGAIGICVIALLKRRNARRQRRLHDQLFDHYTDPVSSTHSPGPSINSTPLDAFSTSPSFFNVDTTQTPQAMASSTTNYYNNQPSHHTATNFGPPVAFNAQTKRGSDQPSIDSFYGGSRQSSDYKGFAL